MKIGVIGSGTMGTSIVRMLVESGLAYEVLWFGRNINAIERKRNELKDKLFVKYSDNKINYFDKLVNTTDSISELKPVDIIIECISESLECKIELLKELSNIVSVDAVIGTNTSSLSITELSSHIQNPERAVGIHFFNPANVMRLVEIIRGEFTSEKTINKADEFARSLNKTVVHVVESPGFIVNRMLIPMINEAICILAEGVSTASEIDQAMICGANHPIGPLSLADLIGNDICLSIMNVLFKETGDQKYRPHPLLKKMVRAHKLGRKTKVGFFTYPVS